jgi:hypothetical protein
MLLVLGILPPSGSGLVSLDGTVTLGLLPHCPELLALSIGYRDALETHSLNGIQIDLDVARTINGHVLFVPFRTRYGLG